MIFPFPITLARPLVRNAAFAFRLPVKLVPLAAQKVILNFILHHLFGEALRDGDFEFLEDRWLELEVRDIGMKWYFTCRGDRLLIESHRDDSDITFSGNLNDFVLIAVRKVDPDTLFFQRRLRVVGPADLGMEIKHQIDNIDLDALPLLLNKLIDTCALIIRDVEADDQDRHAVESA